MADSNTPQIVPPSPEVKILTKAFDPLKLLTIFSDTDYEEIIKEWATSYLKEKSDKNYTRVERLGGAGDKGRDVVCTVDKNIWDNYQCKHYEQKLTPTDIYVEIGKLCYYCYKGDYSIPRKYYFVSPRGVGTKLRDLLIKPVDLKSELIGNWVKHCESKITDKESVKLTGKFKNYIEKFDFSIFDYIEPSDFLEQFKQTPYYSKRFGNLYKPRPLTVACPDEIQKMELEYIKKILQAYGEYVKENISAAKELDKHPDLKEHFKRQRLNFFEAEALKAFSREIHDPELKLYEKLMDEIYNGIIDEISNDAKHGFERLNNVLNRAAEIQITNNPLMSEVKVSDRKGICHHLANEREDVKWVK
jgi:hypothetical protein